MCRNGPEQIRVGGQVAHAREAPDVKEDVGLVRDGVGHDGARADAGRGFTTFRARTRAVCGERDGLRVVVVHDHCQLAREVACGAGTHIRCAPMTREAALLFFLCGALGCAHTASEDAARRLELTKIDPASEPMPPRDPVPHGREQLDTEFYLGSHDQEFAQFQAFAQQIKQIQTQLAGKHAQPMGRGFHAKAHGCLHGELRLRPDRDPRTRFGIFGGETRQWPMWARFSNGVGFRQGDKELDARGFAVKVMGVPGDKYASDEESTQDFLMTNSPTPVGKDAVEFMKFAHANAKGQASAIGFLLGHPRTAGPALTKTGAIDSMVTAQYWSGSAFHLGAHQAVKFTVKPCEGTGKRKPSRKSPDYLRADLVNAARVGICMTFYVQFQTDSQQTPIENASNEWTEKESPLVPVADIVLPAQTFDTDEQTQACEALAFSPWHAIAAHKPMGHINRARLFVYDASRANRKGGGEPKP